MARILIFLCLCFCLMGCSPTIGLFPKSDKPSTPSTLKKFTSDFLTFQYPGYLYEKKPTHGNVIFTATNLDPEESLNNLTYYDLQGLIIINVIQKIQTKHMDAGELLRASIEEVKQLGKVEFISKDTPLKDGTPVLEYILTSPQTSLHLKQYFYCHEGEGYVVTISTPTENWSTISDALNILEKSLTLI